MSIELDRLRLRLLPANQHRPNDETTVLVKRDRGFLTGLVTDSGLFVYLEEVRCRPSIVDVS